MLKQPLREDETHKQDTAAVIISGRPADGSRCSVQNPLPRVRRGTKKAVALCGFRAIFLCIVR